MAAEARQLGRSVWGEAHRSRSSTAGGAQVGGASGKAPAHAARG